MRYFRSLSFRLALTYALIFMFSVGVLTVGYYWIKVIAPTNDVKEQVQREAQIYSQMYIVDGSQRVVDLLQARSLQKSARHPFHALFSSDGTLLSSNLPTWPRYNGQQWRVIEADLYRDGYEIDYAPLVRDIRFKDGARLIIGRDMEDITEITEALLRSVQWIIYGTIFLGLVGGVFMSRAIGNRLEVVNNAARKVMDGDLTGRVKLLGSGDDFDQLASTLNSMLERIERQFWSIRRVSDHVAHELRTPLSRLMTHLELLSQQSFSDEKTQILCDGAYQEAKRLETILSALQRISRIETGSYQIQLSNTELEPLFDAVADAYRPLADLRGIKITTQIDNSAVIAVDRDLLMQALANLVDNAVKFSSDRGEVEIGFVNDDGSHCLWVRNQCESLPDAEIHRLPERFYRGSNAEFVGGDGLGLSLVAAIAKLHKARLFFDNSKGGFIASFIWPATPEPK